MRLPATAGPPEDQQLDFVKGELDVSFALLDKDEAGRVFIAGGPWKGEPWPEASMVHPQLGRIGSVWCAILDPNAQIEIDPVETIPPSFCIGRPVSGSGRMQEAASSAARAPERSCAGSQGQSCGLRVGSAFAVAGRGCATRGLRRRDRRGVVRRRPPTAEDGRR